MGKTLDALLRRNFKTAKFKSLVNLAIARVAVLKNQRYVRCSQARSDTTQLLNLGQQERALLRVEYVIKDQNMHDVFVMIEGFCHVLIERVVLIENNRECPDELKEAISSLIFAASRCGEFPELQEIRSVFATRFGKDFVARAAELRNNCGVNQKMIQKLSTRHPSYESRMKVFKEIASENGITLHLEEEASVAAKENLDLNQKENQPKNNVSGNLDNAKKGDKPDNLIKEDQIEQEEQTSGSLKTRQRYKDVASAAQAAFESAAYAAAAARAAVELSQSESQDNFPNDPSSPATRRRSWSDNDGSSRSGVRNNEVGAAFGEVDHSTNEFDIDRIHSIENSSSESEGEELQQNYGKFHPKDFKRVTSKENMERSISASSLDSVGDSIKVTKMPSNILGQSKPSDNMVFDKSDDETGDEYGGHQWSNEYGNNSIMDSEKKVQLKRLNIERRPISVRTRQGNSR